MIELRSVMLFSPKITLKKPFFPHSLRSGGIMIWGDDYFSVFNGILWFQHEFYTSNIQLLENFYYLCGRNLLVITCQVRLYKVVKPNSLILRKNW